MCATNNGGLNLKTISDLKHISKLGMMAATKCEGNHPKQWHKTPPNANRNFSAMAPFLKFWKCLQCSLDLQQWRSGTATSNGGKISPNSQHQKSPPFNKNRQIWKKRLTWKNRQIWKWSSMAAREWIAKLEKMEERILNPTLHFSTLPKFANKREKSPFMETPSRFK